MKKRKKNLRITSFECPISEYTNGQIHLSNVLPLVSHTVELSTEIASAVIKVKLIIRRKGDYQHDNKQNSVMQAILEPMVIDLNCRFCGYV